MSGIERDKIRKLHSSEYFTPFDKVIERLKAYPKSVWVDKNSQFLDPTCGDGQFLGEVLICKLENGSTFEQALSTIYGTDLMIDNIDLCRERLLCGQEQFRHIVEQNIQCRDALKFNYTFKQMGPARRNTEEKYRSKQQRQLAQQEKIVKLEEEKKQKEAHEKKLFGQVLS